MAVKEIEVSVIQSRCRGCNGRCLGQLLGNRKTVWLQRDHIAGNCESLHHGDQINLFVSPATLIGLSSLAYLLPVVLMLLFILICDRYFNLAEWSVAVGAMSGLMLGVVGARLSTDWLSRNIGPRIRLVSNR